MQTSTPICLIVTAAVALSVGCREEQKHLRALPPGGMTGPTVQQSDLQPGPAIRVRRVQNPYEGNAHAIAEGKRLYNHYNCSGCHANGGGAIGPPFIDEEWIYGQAAEIIFSVIVEGRPQGMPAFGGRIPEHQVWQIVSYVRSMADLGKGTAPEPVAREASGNGRAR